MDVNSAQANTMTISPSNDIPIGSATSSVSSVPPAPASGLVPDPGNNSDFKDLPGLEDTPSEKALLEMDTVSRPALASNQSMVNLPPATDHPDFKVVPPIPSIDDASLPSPVSVFHPEEMVVQVESLSVEEQLADMRSQLQQLNEKIDQLLENRS